nr:putative ribonuclease H-like domain-containing protein [Tanacetum cinerariifolium]
VILNGDSPAPTRVIEGVVQPVAPTTDERRLARKNELKARGTLLMALLDKHQLKFSIHKDAKTLMEAIEKMFGGNKETKKKLISQLEILGESLSQEDINLKFLRSLPTEWRTHTLIWRNKTYLKEQSLDDLFNSLKIYEAEVKSSSSASTFTQNLAFVSSQTTDSTNDPVSAVASVSVASAKILVFALPNVDTLSNAQIDADDLEEMDLKWQMAMLIVRARRFLQRTGRNLGENRPTSIGFDMSKVECYNCHMKGHFARECRSPKDTRRNGAAEPQRSNVLVETSTSNALVSQCDGVGSYDWSFQAEEEPTNYALMAFTSSRLESVEARLLVYQQNEYVFEEDTKLLKLEVQLRENALVVLRQKFKIEEQERDDLNLKLAKFQTFSKNLSQLLASQTNDKTGLGYNTQVFPISMFDCDEMFTSETDESLPASPIYDRYQSRDGYHVVPPPYTGTFMPPKPDLVSDSEDDSEAEIPQNAYSFIQITKKVKTPRSSVKTVETSIPAENHKTTILKPKINGNHRNRKACFICKSLTHLIKDLLTKSKLVPIIAARPVTAAVLKPHVTRPRQAKTVVTKPYSPPRKHINRSPSPKASTFPPKVTAAKSPMVNAVKGNWGNPQHALKDKRVINSGRLRHMTRNMSYLSNFEELNGRYVAFGGNPKGGNISGKGKIRIGKLDFDDVYFVKELKFNLFSVSQMCDKKNSVLFTDTECLVLSPEFKLPDENQVLLRVPRENNMYNVDLKNIVPSVDLTCLFAKATLDESNLWHRRLGHINFKTMNKLVKGNLVRGLPTKFFENNHTCVAYKKGKQHRASCKTKPVSSVSQPLQRLKKAQEKDKIRSKPDKNGKRGEAKKNQKQLQ